MESGRRGMRSGPTWTESLRGRRQTASAGGGGGASRSCVGEASSIHGGGGARRSNGSRNHPSLGDRPARSLQPAGGASGRLGRGAIQRRRLVGEQEYPSTPNPTP